MNILYDSIDKSIKSRTSHEKIECGQFLIDISSSDETLSLTLHRHIIDVTFYNMYGWIPKYKFVVDPHDALECINYLEPALKSPYWASMEFALLGLVQTGKISLLV